MTKWNYPEAVRTLQFSNIEFFRTFRNPKNSKTSTMWFKWDTIRKISAFTQSNVINKIDLHLSMRVVGKGSWKNREVEKFYVGQKCFQLNVLSYKTRTWKELPNFKLFNVSNADRPNNKHANKSLGCLTFSWKGWLERSNFPTQRFFIQIKSLERTSQLQTCRHGTSFQLAFPTIRIRTSGLCARRKSSIQVSKIQGQLTRLFENQMNNGFSLRK